MPSVMGTRNVNAITFPSASRKYRLHMVGKTSRKPDDRPILARVKIIQWTLAFVGAAALAIVLVGLVLPSTFSIERSIEIKAPARTIYDYVVEPKQWTRWSVWTRRDPAMRITYSGPPFGMGAKWSWVSKSEGAGSMQFTRVEPDRRVEYALAFPGFGMKSIGALAIEPAGERMKVTWTN